MTRRGTGLGFIGISALLFATRHIAAAIFGSGTTSWNSELYLAMLGYVDQGLSTASIVALVLGGAYLLWAELSESRRRIG
jgi:hypothetical protein